MLRRNGWREAAVGTVWKSPTHNARTGLRHQGSGVGRGTIFKLFVVFRRMLLYITSSDAYAHELANGSCGITPMNPLNLVRVSPILSGTYALKNRGSPHSSAVHDVCWPCRE